MEPLNEAESSQNVRLKQDIDGTLPGGAGRGTVDGTLNGTAAVTVDDAIEKTSHGPSLEATVICGPGTRRIETTDDESRIAVDGRGADHIKQERVLSSPGASVESRGGPRSTNDIPAAGETVPANPPTGPPTAPNEAPSEPPNEAPNEVPNEAPIEAQDGAPPRRESELKQPPLNDPQMLMSNLLDLLTKLTKSARPGAEEEKAEELPPCRTLYINNLNDRIRLSRLRETLQDLFKKHGTVTEIVALSSFWRRGQAFVSFQSTEEAARAKDALSGHVLNGKPMRINFAREESLNAGAVAPGSGLRVRKRKDKSEGPSKPRAIREREQALQQQFWQLQQQMALMGIAPTHTALSPGLPLAPTGAPLQGPLPPPMHHPMHQGFSAADFPPLDPLGRQSFMPPPTLPPMMPPMAQYYLANAANGRVGGHNPTSASAIKKEGATAPASGPIDARTFDALGELEVESSGKRKGPFSMSLGESKRPRNEEASAEARAGGSWGSVVVDGALTVKEEQFEGKAK